MGEMKFLTSGDKSMVVEFGTVIDEKINNQVQELKEKLQMANISGIVSLLPTFRSLMITYNPKEITFAKIATEIKSLGEITGESFNNKKRILKIPCCYGARFGMDLRDMEDHTGLSRDEIISIHSSVDYKIYMLGFLPGFVYLGGLDKRIEMPRLSNPRLKIRPGSVGIAGDQTGVYPLASPGGWRLIGGTPVDFYNPDREDPILCKAGEYIRFVPISIGDYYDIRHEIMKGTYKVDVEEVLK
ncbi:MAG: 5-oxoprolinase subunit PxpB [Lachnospiraceae bacterium]|jgi:KipI family sensor histidine kinase inhibitor|nr:5-oxoprolinase subunit PxpB [Lachnospiraceae bacterium]